MMALAGALCLGCTSDTDEVTDENGDTSGEVITEPSDDSPEPGQCPPAVSVRQTADAGMSLPALKARRVPAAP